MRRVRKALDPAYSLSTLRGGEADAAIPIEYHVT